MTVATGPARLALAAYPPWFKARYGDEQREVVEAAGGSLSVDLVVGAAHAWLRPRFVGPGVEVLAGRRQATVSTMWVCWCVITFGGMAVLRVLEDPPPQGYDPHSGGWLAVHLVLGAAMLAGWLVVVAVGAPLGIRALARGREVRRAVLPFAVMTVAALLLLVPLQVYAWSHWLDQGSSAADAGGLPVWWIALGLVWLALTAGSIVAGTVGLPVALRRAAFTAAELRLPSVAASCLPVPMAAVVAMVVAVVVGAEPASAGVFSAGVVVVTAGVGLALVVALVSAGRLHRLSPARPSA